MRRYTLTAIALHWLMAILIIAAFFLGLTMVNIPGLTPTKLKYFSWHKWLGVTVFALACLFPAWFAALAFGFAALCVVTTASRVALAIRLFR